MQNQAYKLSSTTATRVVSCEERLTAVESTANTAKSTADIANTNASTCYKDVSISENVLTFTTVDGDTKEVALPPRTQDAYIANMMKSSRIDLPTSISPFVNNISYFEYLSSNTRFSSDYKLAVAYYVKQTTGGTHDDSLASLTKTDELDSAIRKIIMDKMSELGNIKKVTISGTFFLSEDGNGTSYRPDSITPFSAINNKGDVSITDLTMPDSFSVPCGRYSFSTVYLYLRIDEINIQD